MRYIAEWTEAACAAKLASGMYRLHAYAHFSPRVHAGNPPNTRMKPCLRWRTRLLCLLSQAQVADGPTRALLRQLLHPDPAVRAAFDFTDALKREPFFRLAIGSAADDGEGMSRLRLERNEHGKLCYVLPDKIDKVSGARCQPSVPQIL